MPKLLCHVLCLLNSGEVMLDKQKNAGILTVVNKSGIIEETFRFFKMEVLAGEDKMETTVVSNGCSFSFDFSKVYWNSRLDQEHCRIVRLLKRKDVVLDMFAGVWSICYSCMQERLHSVC